MAKRLSAYPRVDDHIQIRIYCPRCAESRETHIQDAADFPAEQDFTGGNLLNAACGHCGALFGVCPVCGWTTGVPGCACVNGHNPPPEPLQESEGSDAATDGAGPAGPGDGDCPTLDETEAPPSLVSQVLIPRPKDDAPEEEASAQ